MPLELPGLTAPPQRQVYFVPAFFLPPRTILDDPAIDAAFAWNGAWEIHGAGSGCAEEREFMASVHLARFTQNELTPPPPFSLTEPHLLLLMQRKPYMSAVSPCFFTHYGTKPPFAFNKNWICE